MNWIPAIIFGVALIFNAGIVIGYIRNHMKHIKEEIAEIKVDVDKIYTKVNANSTDIAKIQGRLNNKS